MASYWWRFVAAVLMTATDCCRFIAAVLLPVPIAVGKNHPEKRTLYVRFQLARVINHSHAKRSARYSHWAFVLFHKFKTNSVESSGEKGVIVHF